MSSDPSPAARRRFLGILSVTLFAVYALILLGGIVRSTGAGMGCPDWPRCFGEWIPPTSVEQLPEDYQEVYLAQRQDKNLRLSKTLSRLGMTELADQVLHEETVAVETEFNAVKTWTEYINRLAGALIGLLVIATVVASTAWWKSRPSIVVWSLLTLLAVIFNGWTGSLVVSTNLLPWMVTFHMLLALLVVALLIFLRHAAKLDGSGADEMEDRGAVNWILFTALAAMVVQIAMGTQVREGVDSIALMMENTLRETWIENLGVTFYVHRSFSLLLVFLHSGLLWILHRQIGAASPLRGRFRWLLALTVLEAGSGAVLAYFALPPAVQPLHLLMATLIFALQFEILLELNYRPQRVSPSAKAASDSA